VPLSPHGVALKAAVRARVRQGERERQQREQDSPDRQSAVDTLLGFCRWTFPGYHTAPHLELVASELEAIERGENDRLIIEMPPRHGKSELVTIRFPAWVLCRHPNWPLISASYGDELAHEMGRRARNIVDTQGIFPEVNLAADSKAKNLWHTTQGGQFLAVGIGSGVIGFGGRIITIDDPSPALSEQPHRALRLLPRFATKEIPEGDHRRLDPVVMPRVGKSLVLLQPRFQPGRPFRY